MGQTWAHVRWEWARGRSVGVGFFLETAVDTVRWVRCMVSVGLTSWQTHWQLQRRECCAPSWAHLTVAQQRRMV